MLCHYINASPLPHLRDVPPEPHGQISCEEIPFGRFDSADFLFLRGEVPKLMGNPPGNLAQKFLSVKFLSMKIGCTVPLHLYPIHWPVSPRRRARAEKGADNQSHTVQTVWVFGQVMTFET